MLHSGSEGWGKKLALVDLIEKKRLNLNMNVLQEQLDFQEKLS